MSTARNWLQTLWRTSYKGALFWVETDVEGGARRIVIHEFPMSEQPYLEDLGQRYREFTVTAYLASNNVDAEAAVLMEVCVGQRGPGLMVLPTQGPVLVRCLEATRTHEKDKMGFIAYSLKFVREGALSSLISVANLTNMIFVQAETAALAAATAYSQTAAVTNVPDYVQEAVQTSTENALATLEVVRTTVNVDPVVNAEQRDVIAATYASLPAIMADTSSKEVVSENLSVVGQAVINVAMALAENMDPAVAITTWGNIIEVTPLTPTVQPILGSVWQPVASSNAQAGDTLLRLAALIAYCEAVAKVPLGDRQSAITLRANVASFFEEQLGALPSEAYELYAAMIKLRDATIDYLSRSVIDLAPVVRVSASLSMPSIFWAYRLYADPARSSELVARNRVEHPSFMPLQFEALGR